MVADALSTALERHGFWHKGRLCLPFEAVTAAVLPRWFCDPEAKDTRRLPPGMTPERLAALVQRADADAPQFAAADRDLDALERLGWMLRPRKTRKRTRRDQRDSSHVVVRQTHAGVKPA